MRSLFTLAQHISAPLPDAAIERVAVDPEHGTVFSASVASDATADSGLITVRIHAQFAPRSSGAAMSSQGSADEMVELARIETPAASRAPVQLYADQPASDRPQIVSLHYLADGGELSSYAPALCLVSAGGDIVFIPLPEDLDELRQSGSAAGPALEPNVVGSVEQGVAAAAWSPDDELLTIVTEETGAEDGISSATSPKVLLMTKAFDVLSERAIYTREFGEDEPVDVGWGSRATQFHGSAGKAAAAAAAAEAEAAKQVNAQHDPRGPATRDDDGLARISWRGDGAFFMISVLEPFQSASGASSSQDAGLRHHRIIRVFARDGNLSATSEPTVRGLTHVLCVRPTGNIIASSQRFGALGSTGAEGQTDPALQLAKGRQGRHDIVFFERNGLRHGEFSLREEGEAQPGVGEAGTTVQKLSWTREHTIKEIAWNSDGSALAVHLSRSTEGGSEEVVQVWTTGNYHWYLKQELDAASLGLVALQAHVKAMVWHPEAPHDIFLTWSTPQISLIEHRSFFLDTAASSSITPPHDAACVSVTDGAALLLTSLRLQNVPPPMCSFSLIPPPQNPDRLDRVPVHVAWADVRGSTAGSISILAVLYPGAVVSLHALCWGQMPRAAPQGARRFPTPVDLGTMHFPAAGNVTAAIQVAASARVQAPGAAPEGHQGEMTEVEIGVLAGLGLHRVVSVRRISVTLGGDSGSITSESDPRVLPIPAGTRRCRLVAIQGEAPEDVGTALCLHTSDGSLLTVGADDHFEPVSDDLPQFCPYLTILQKTPLQGFGLSQSGQLLAIRGESASPQILARDATSFAVASSFLVWTNTAHQARFLPLQTIFQSGIGNAVDGQSGAEAVGETMTLGRSVERGSRIVVAVPSSMSLVLQMPRGNLETVCPRPMVLEVVRAALDRRRYGMAFRICRTHRLDMNILHDHDPVAFLEHLPTFIDQVKDVDHLNLFLTSLRDDDVTEDLYKPILQSDRRPRATEQNGKVNRIATRIREELQARDQKTYINTVITAFVSMKPPAHESALELLGKLRAEDANLADEAVRYIIFLADADKLFDVALGTYDFALVLMVAQHAKRKDPREYLPFLRELRALQPIEYQRFRIDEHLGRRVKAMKWLLAAGLDYHEQAMEYIRKHKLHAEAIETLSSQPQKLAEVHFMYAEHLEDRSKLHQAALAYMVSGNRRKALHCFRQAAEWKDALALAVEERLPASEVKALVREAADDLEGKAKYVEAARIHLDYERDVEQAVSLLCKANELSEARRICAFAGRKDLVETTIKPGALDIQERLSEELEEMREQMDKQVARLAELRSKKTENPAAFYMENDPALDNVDVMTDTSTQITQFTRYTSVPSLASMSTSSGMTASTNKSKKNKRKEERKKNSGKKGSVYEEDYLFESLQKLLKDRLRGLQQEVSRLLPHLAVLSPSHRSAAKALQDALDSFESAAKAAGETLWQAELEEERTKAAELDRLVSAGPEVWMGAYRSLMQGALGRRGAGAPTASPTAQLKMRILSGIASLVAAMSLLCGLARARMKLPTDDAMNYMQTRSVEQRGWLFDPTCRAIRAVISNASQVFAPGEAAYTQDMKHYCASSDIYSKCAVEPATAEDVAAILRVLANSTTPFAIRGAGHSCAPGFSGSKGVTIAMRRFNEVTYDKASNVVRYGMGLVWDDVYRALEPFDVKVTGGRVTNVGVAGFSLGGGYSFITNQYGLTSDGAVAYDLVTPQGLILHVTKKSYPDLFFLLQGGFNNAGVVTNVYVTGRPRAKIWGGYLFFDNAQRDKVINLVGQFSSANNTDPLGSMLTTLNHFAGIPVLEMQIFYDDPAGPPAGSFVKSIFDQLLALPLVRKNVSTWTMAGYTGASPSEKLAGMRGTFSTVSLERLTPEILEVIKTESQFYGSTALLGAGIFTSYDLEPFVKSSYPAGTSTAWPHDKMLSPLNIYFAWPLGLSDGIFYDAIRKTTAKIRAAALAQGQKLDGLYPYPNYALYDTPLEHIYGPNLLRMQKVAAKYDPAKVMTRSGGFMVQK
ncbi:putative elongator complex protein 1 [Tilletia horrida]|nr:putative elongator complex protein 1 [Tilletia horrida]